MKLQKGTLYALDASVALARSWSSGPVTVARVAKGYALPQAVVAKVFQQLGHAGLTVGTRGTRGGYRLARSPHTVTVLDVIDAFEPPRPRGRSARGGDPAVRRVLDEVDEAARCTFASITLETMVGGRSVTGRVAAPRRSTKSAR